MLMSLPSGAVPDHLMSRKNPESEQLVTGAMTGHGLY